jgi:hypothetical protein
LWSQEVEEIAGQRYRCQATFSDIFRRKFRYHPKIFCLKPYLHGIERFFLEKGEWRMGKEKGERKKERGEWVKEQKEKNQEKRERERPYIGRKIAVILNGFKWTAWIGEIVAGQFLRDCRGSQSYSNILLTLIGPPLQLQGKNTPVSRKAQTLVG